mgnify:CR=1 FL=1|tara:strand:+ start:6926 stop:7294 length:369 start_codon:yes stop_codon:yes gene_type:complete
MFTVFVLFSFSIGILTFLALKKDGSNQADIKITLSFMASNSKALIKNIRTLIKLLIKDLFEDSNSTVSISSDSSEEIFVENQDYIKNSSNINPLNESIEDESIIDFSPEVIEIIREEEDKVA